MIDDQDDTSDTQQPALDIQHTLLYLRDARGAPQLMLALDFCSATYDVDINVSCSVAQFQVMHWRAKGLTQAAGGASSARVSTTLDQSNLHHGACLHRSAVHTKMHEGYLLYMYCLKPLLGLVISHWVHCEFLVSSQQLVDLSEPIQAAHSTYIQYTHVLVLEMTVSGFHLLAAVHSTEARAIYTWEVYGCCLGCPALSTRMRNDSMNDSMCVRIFASYNLYWPWRSIECLMNFQGAADTGDPCADTSCPCMHAHLHCVQIRTCKRYPHANFICERRPNSAVVITITIS